MFIKKAGLILTVAGALTFGGISISHAAGPSPSNSVSSENATTHHAKLLKAAQRLAINPTGKSDSELKAEIKQVVLNNITARAKNLGLTTNGKTIKEIRKEIKTSRRNKITERLDKAAQRLGISPEGKTNKELRLAIHTRKQANVHQRLINRANKLNIPITNSMTNQQIRAAIKANRTTQNLS